jgi:hypothetical protein
MNQLFQPKFANPSAPAAATVTKEKWMKDGFLNFDLPDPRSADGFAKFGSIGIDLKNVRHRKLIEWLLADGGAHYNDRIKVVQQSFRITFRTAEKDESVGFVLPGM